MIFSLANNFRHILFQFYRLPSKRNEYEEWGMHNRHSAITSTYGLLRVLLPVSVIWVLGSCFLLLTGTSIGFAQETSALKNGANSLHDVSTPSWSAGKAFDKSLQRSFSLAWQNAPLRARITQLAKQQKISIVVDRRVDPSRAIDLATQQVTMPQMLLKICKQQDLSFCRIGDSYYVGPKASAECLFLLEHPIKRLKQPKVLRVEAPMDWPDLTTSQEALEHLVNAESLRVTNIEKLPYDLMAGVSTAPMTLANRLRLLLIQFDLDYEIDSRGTRLKLVDASDSTGRGKIRFLGAKLSLKEFKKLKNQLKKCDVDRQRDTIQVQGPVEELMVARNLMAQRFRPPTADDSAKRFTLTITSRRSAILAAIGQQLNLKVDSSGATEEQMDRVLTLSVTEVSLQTMLDKIVQGTGNTCSVAGGKIIVTRAR